MVRLRLRVGPKGQIVLPQFIREKLGIKPKSFIAVDFDDDCLSIKREFSAEEVISWLKNTRRPIAKDVSKISIEDELLEGLS